ncbi:thiosulfate oxidation carrier protein SoxY [Hyphomonas sp.]|uniref:thiosulfate oxidation carrier protein SoxY n=1 Tax=Hyphomonas sp. TaxID=87 RepID=UPI00352988BF
MPDDNRSPSTVRWTRRAVLASTGLVSIASILAPLASATPEDADQAIRDIFGDRPVNPGRVTVTLPPIAENGNSVSIGISVDSPMTDADHVKQIVILSPRNPIATIARFHLGPHAGRAEVSTRVRMAGTQTLRVIAEMSDGTLWSGTGSTYVTLAACIIG